MSEKSVWWFLDTSIIEHAPVGAPDVFVFEQLLPEGASPPLHVHDGLDDSFYALEGRIVVRRGDELFLAEAGSWVSVPRGTPHTFRVLDGPARILLVHDDASFRDLVHDLGVPAARHALPEPTGGPGLERLGQALVDHDSRVVGPSMSEGEALAFLVDAGTAVPELYRRAADRFGRLVHAVRADQWTLPTPCAKWDVRALVGHVVTENLWIPPLLEGRTVSDVGDRLDGDPLGVNPRPAWDGSVAAATAAIHAAGVMDQIVHLSFGDVPGHEYLTQLVADLVIHGWDLAHAIGQDETLDPELVVVCASWFSRVADQARQAGVVGPALPVPETADPQTRLLADFGREASSLYPAGLP